MLGTRFLIPVAGFCVSLAFAIPRSDAQETIHIQIPAQPLSEALLTLAQQYSTNILFADPESVPAQQSVPISGPIPLQDALDRLLRGSGYRYWYEDSTIFIERIPRVVANELPRPKPSQEPSEKVEVVITGTHIRDKKRSPSLPIKILTVDDIEVSGAGSFTELTRMPVENFHSITPETVVNNGDHAEASANHERGTSYNLFGLGAPATLTLLNGQRFPAAGSDATLTDVSFLPLRSIERVEIVNGGASAIYGSDAVSGVVNIVLRQGFEGAETTVRHEHTQQGGGSKRVISQVVGASWDTRKAMLVLEHDDEQPLEADERESVPELPGKFSLWPKQRRISGVVTFQDNPSDSTSINADLLIGARSFDHSSVFQRYTTQSEGDVEQVRGAFSLLRELDGGGSVTLFGNYGQHRARVLNTSAAVGSDAPDPPVEFNSQSSIASTALHAQRSIFSMWGDDVTGMLGVGLRREAFGRAEMQLHRYVGSVFTEIAIPLIGAGKNGRSSRELELTLAGRYDDYFKTGMGANLHSVDPKVGLVWSPVEGFRMRGTWGTSFRAPAMSHMNVANDSALQTVLEDPNAVDGRTIGLVLFGGNQNLQPERSESYTLGIDLSHPAVPNFDLSTTFFSTKYFQRIGMPQVTGSPADALKNFSSLEPFITVTPTDAYVHELYDRYHPVDFTGTGEEGVGAVVDYRYRNISSLEAKGFTLSAQYGFTLAGGWADLYFNGSYLLGLKHKTSPVSEVVDILDTEFNPSNFRFWTAARWQRGPVHSAISFNYIDAYKSSLDSELDRVSAWFTSDAQVAYEFSGRDSLSWLADLELRLGVQNLTNRRPPAIGAKASPLRYDPSHSSILGRTFYVQLQKTW